ncbi:unnamed protein product, partial [Protopolystoma xenopodis]
MPHVSTAPSLPPVHLDSGSQDRRSVVLGLEKPIRRRHSPSSRLSQPVLLVVLATLFITAIRLHSCLSTLPKGICEPRTQSLQGAYGDF